jgi:putative SOS response-associated peptidase YedK
MVWHVRRHFADVHDRMPVILPDDVYDLWLDPGFQKADAICDLLRSFGHKPHAAIYRSQDGELQLHIRLSAPVMA